MRRAALRSLIVWAGLLFLPGCGFHLRGQPSLPFDSVYVDAARGSALAPLLTQHLRLNGKRVLDNAAGAQVVIRIDQETRNKEILSLSGGGKVREYRLGYRLVLSATDGKGGLILAPTELKLTRDYSYDDAQVLAKAGEEVELMRDMEQDMLRQVVRRLASPGLKLRPRDG
ncbi:MAG: LPS-assembly lipoprotein LptE [Thiobacillaceae bacterium]